MHLDGENLDRTLDQVDKMQGISQSLSLNPNFFWCGEFENQIGTPSEERRLETRSAEEEKQHTQKNAGVYSTNNAIIFLLTLVVRISY
jgi:hypothetical protein